MGTGKEKVCQREDVGETPALSKMGLMIINDGLVWLMDTNKNHE